MNTRPTPSDSNNAPGQRARGSAEWRQQFRLFAKDMNPDLEDLGPAASSAIGAEAHWMFAYPWLVKLLTLTACDRAKEAFYVDGKADPVTWEHLISVLQHTGLADAARPTNMRGWPQLVTSIVLRCLKESYRAQRSAAEARRGAVNTC